MQEEWHVELKRLIDKHGLGSVLGGIASICYGKAEHLRSNWQEDVMAKLWEKDADKVNRVADSVNG